MTDTLRCRCGGEVAIVRLNPELLTLGHVRNPKDKHHAVRLQVPRTGRESASPVPPRVLPEDTRGRPEAPDASTPALTSVGSPPRSGRA